ncbi:tripartite tricarboxylate transporter substrate binding protein [Calidifontimicrobium sp. SYSU G02091]|uniref:Bug family tripartite tricarboxylate transporter substrate binding protein n=1 Tax=Calidifontimicrobium sp. SYSU G02091 TaxID=2926421 RepID=UPI001F539996|nr:tripartite tricarboxylate transporter substrate binding protein [Calidifontimicrobium sp. SYSU G02091]MCI1193581.1 tripartite tricarboxylate transporter substrate binding protein [Calidifontimicrobium sp. SYSU G02091]
MAHVTNPPRRRAAAAALALLATGLAPAVHAQERWPSRPIRLVVPFPPGGSSDVAARLLAPRLGERLGQQVVVENRPGAGGTLALGQVAKAAPDGYTLVLAAAGGLTISPGLNPNLGYDPLADLAPITGFARIPFVLVANADLPVSRADELIALARRQPGRLTFASGGNGTAMHLGGELMKSMSETFIVHIPYRGSAPAITAVMAGETQLAVSDITSVLGKTEGGRMKVIGVMSKDRTDLAPGVPTLDETGLKGFDVSGWFAIMAPARTPQPIVARLNAEITSLIRTDEFRERFKTLGMEPIPTTPEELTQMMRAELARWAAVIKRAGVKAE